MQLEKMNEFLGQSKNDGFNESVWVKYKESSEYKTTISLINVDMKHSKSLMEELLKKTKDVVNTSISKESNSEKKDILNKFLTIIDNNYKLDNKFKQIFK